MNTKPTAPIEATAKRAIELISTHHLSHELVFNLLGRIEQSAKNEIEGLKTKTCAELLTEFAEDKAELISKCPCMKPPNPAR